MTLAAAQNLAAAIENAARVDFEFASLGIALETSTRHNLKTTHHLNITGQFPFELELPSIDIGIDFSVRAQHQ